MTPLPLNCVTRAFAAQLCEALGKSLPSEAQWEFAARNRTLESRFPWGDDPNDCSRTITGRGRTPFELSEGDESDDSCRLQPDGSLLPPGPVAGGAVGDTSALGLRNLSGNVAEWVLDNAVASTAPCWVAPAGSVLQDPVCTGGSTRPGFRGGGYDDVPSLSFSAARNSATLDAGFPDVGFRCVTPGP